jgi:hypothetical protein
LYVARYWGGKREFPKMKPFTISAVVGAMAIAGTAVAHAQSVDVEYPSILETDTLPRLPNVFRDCWEPLPAHCVRPPGLLWFGDAATLRRERRASHGSRHLRTAIVR